MNEKTNLDKAFENLMYVFDSSKFSGFGHRFISNKKFFEAVEQLKISIQQNLESAKRIERDAQEVMEEARIEAKRIIRVAEEEVEAMDKVELAKDRASEIIEMAKQTAIEMVDEGEEMREASISHAESIRNKIIQDSYQVLKKNLDEVLESMEISYKTINGSLEKANLLVENEGSNSIEDKDQRNIS